MFKSKDEIKKGFDLFLSNRYNKHYPNPPKWTPRTISTVVDFVFEQLKYQEVEAQLKHVLDFVAQDTRPISDYKMVFQTELDPPYPEDFDGQNCTFIGAEISLTVLAYLIVELIKVGVVEVPKTNHSPLKNIIIYTFKK